MERVRGPTQVGQKSWRVLSVALAFSCLESFRDFSLLKRVILLGDWVGVAKRKGLVPPFLVRGRLHKICAVLYSLCDQELLALVVEKNKKKDDTKQEEEKYIDYVAKQAILFGAAERVAKTYWWIGFIVSLGFFSIFASVAFSYFMASLFTKSGENYLAKAVFFFVLTLGIAFGIFALYSGKREYERLKRKKENQGQS
jgi:hypothetical protein